MTENTVTITVTNFDQQPDGCCPTITEEDIVVVARLLHRATQQGDLQSILYEAAIRIRNDFQDDAKLAAVPTEYKLEQEDLLKQLVLAAREAAKFSNGTVHYGTTGSAKYEPSPLSEEAYQTAYPMLDID
jgi:hypothetical protein